MFQYEVMTEEQAMQERFQLLKEGEYDAVIRDSKDTISASSGNSMMDMTVSVFDENGKDHDVRDFLVFTKSMMWKVVHFAESANIIKEYETGNLCSDVAIGKRARVKIVIEQGSQIPEDKLKGKPAGSLYPDKNKIEDYIKAGDKKDSDLLDDDIAF